MTRRFVPLALVLAACSSNPEPQAAPTPQATGPAAVVATAEPAATTFALTEANLIGVYDLTIEAMGQSRTVRLAIKRGDDGKLAGQLESGEGPTITVDKVTIEGKKVVAL